jgi:NAD-dependent dihydropyrimidine dehydrogenase PreA subunit
MAFTIADPCINTKDTACVNVCPVDCIHPRKDEDAYPNTFQLFIDPDTCIDCGACVPECPVTAIFPNDDVPENWREYIDKNADYFKLSPEDFTAKWSEHEEATYVNRIAEVGEVKEEGKVAGFDYAAHGIEV